MSAEDTKKFDLITPAEPGIEASKHRSLKRASLRF
jgi:hypothetical protein